MLPRLPWVGVVALAAGCAHAGDTVVEHFDGVLGTSMDVTVIGAVDAVGGAIDDALAEVERLEGLLSGYRADSEVSRLNRLRELEGMSEELHSVLARCAFWTRRSDNRFSCKLGRVRDAWRSAERDQMPPNRVRLRRLARDIAKSHLVLADAPSAALQLPDPVDVDLGGIAKGFIVDRVLDMLRGRLPDAVAIKVDIGGDARYWGKPPDSEGWRVGIGPDAGAGYLVVTDLAVAASGHAERGFRVGRRQYSHLLAARDGWPLSDAPAAFVTAPEAGDADAIATALVSMPPQEAISWVSAMSEVEALLVLANGTQLASPGWRARQRTSIGVGSVARLRVEYTIPRMEVGEYRRPYVAMWITAGDRRHVVRNLLLLGESRRWARENSRWWRQVGSQDVAVLDGLAVATRRPGHYVVTWDGFDDHGRPVGRDGPLTLHVEAAREYGGHDYQRIAIQSGTPARHQRPARGEIGPIDLRWVTSPDLAFAP